MTDRYEEFKEWYYNSEYSNYNNISDLFKEFEEYIEDKDRILKTKLLNAILPCGTKGSVVNAVIDVLREEEIL